MTCDMTPNAKVSDGRQPPMTIDLSLCESAGSRPLDRFGDELGRYAATWQRRARVSIGRVAA